MAVCSSAIVLLQVLLATIVDGTISITSVKSYPSPRTDMLCLGDSVNYSCEINDSASTSLTWRVTYPGGTRIIAHRYDVDSDLNAITQLANGVMVVLRIFYMTEMYIKAFLFIKIQENNIAMLNGTTLECIGEFNSTYVSINNVVEPPLTPTNFTVDNYTYNQEYGEVDAYIVWVLPQESSEVDNFTLTINPSPFIGDPIIVTSLFRSGAIFAIYQIYTANLITANCGGQSDYTFMATDGNKFTLIYTIPSAISGVNEIKIAVLIVTSIMVIILIAIVSLLVPCQLYLHGFTLPIKKKQESSSMEDVSSKIKQDESIGIDLNKLVEDDIAQSGMINFRPTSGGTRVTTPYTARSGSQSQPPFSPMLLLTISPPPLKTSPSLISSTSVISSPILDTLPPQISLETIPSVEKRISPLRTPPSQPGSPRLLSATPPSRAAHRPLSISPPLELFPPQETSEPLEMSQPLAICQPQETLEEVQKSSSVPTLPHLASITSRQASPSLPIFVPLVSSPLPSLVPFSRMETSPSTSPSLEALPPLHAFLTHSSPTQSQSEKSSSEAITKEHLPPSTLQYQDASSPGRILTLGPISIGKKKKLMLEFRSKRNNLSFFYRRRIKIAPEIPKSKLQSKQASSCLDIQETDLTVLSIASIDDVHTDTEETDCIIPVPVKGQNISETLMYKDFSTPSCTVVNGGPEIQARSSLQSDSNITPENLEDYGAEQDVATGATHEGYPNNSIDMLERGNKYDGSASHNINEVGDEEDACVEGAGSGSAIDDAIGSDSEDFFCAY